jgi:hypothetical protein
MARMKDYSIKKDVKEMAKQRIIILSEKNHLAIIKDVLYQIRCNIFHGEKTPGDLNDDRIVKSIWEVCIVFSVYHSILCIVTGWRSLFDRCQ